MECPGVRLVARSEQEVVRSKRAGRGADEPGRQRVEGPPRPVVIAHRVALGRLEVTVDQFAAFVAETGIAVSGGCSRFDPERSRFLLTEGSFLQPGFEQTG